MKITASGRLLAAQWGLSCNYDSRPPGEAIRLVVIHNISLPPRQFGGEGVAQLFGNALQATAHPFYAQIAHLRVSAHLFIRRDGQLVQFVPLTARAWHAGVSCWQGRERCNDFSIGIELEGCDDVPFTSIQYMRLAQVLTALYARYPTIHGVAGHADIAPGRKTDPGACFDWAQVPLPPVPAIG